MQHCKSIMTTNNKTITNISVTTTTVTFSFHLISLALHSLSIQLRPAFQVFYGLYFHHTRVILRFNGDIWFKSVGQRQLQPTGQKMGRPRPDRYNNFQLSIKPNMSPPPPIRVSKVSRFSRYQSEWHIVLLRYPKPTPKPRFFCKNRPSPKPRLFCHNWQFWGSSAN